MSFCKFEGCEKNASYGFEEKTYCFKHSRYGMINLRKNKCKFENCEKNPSCNFPNLKPLFCYEHKIEGMIDVQHRRCKEEGCMRRALHNFPGFLKRGIYCLKHRKDGMKYIRPLSSMCKKEGCTKFSFYGEKGSTKGIYCSEHKIEGMINVKKRDRIEKFDSGVQILADCFSY